MAQDPRIVVIGLGYVGLPLTVALARAFDVTGFDINESRVAELRRGHDRTREVPEVELRAAQMGITSSKEECRGADVYIVTVPTPVDQSNKPDLSAVLAATATVAQLLDPARKPLIVYESTVFPGVTEDICGPEIEQIAGLKRGRDFRLGYSPERINPGDREHTITRIIKVIAGEDEETFDHLERIYGAITTGGVFRAASIKAAEAAKVIENAQRDINIAFMNEVAQIFSKVGVSVWDVLAAARTKWNFLPFEPGLVGGHCIGVDPYYLSHLSEKLGHRPQVILAGRDTNDNMGRWIADALHGHRGKAGSALVLGITFKENVPDIRNSQSVDLVRRLQWLGHDVEVADAHADPDELRSVYALESRTTGERGYDLIVGAVPHREYCQLSDRELRALLNPGGTIADLKGMWRNRAGLTDLDRWTL